MNDTNTTMPVLHLPEDPDEAHDKLTAVLHAAPGVWHEVWYPSTTEIDYDVLCYIASKDLIDSHDPFASCPPVYLAMIGART